MECRLTRGNGVDSESLQDKTMARVAITDAALSDAPLQRDRRLDCPARGALDGQAPRDPRQHGSVTSGPDETLPQLCELSHHTWPTTPCTTNSHGVESVVRPSGDFFRSPLNHAALP